MVENTDPILIDGFMKVVLLHDWLVGMRGGERVLEAFCELFPDAPLYTLIHKEKAVSNLIEDRKIETSFHRGRHVA